MTTKKTVCACALSAITGYLAGWFITKTRLSIQYQESCKRVKANYDASLELIKEHYEQEQVRNQNAMNEKTAEIKILKGMTVPSYPTTVEKYISHSEDPTDICPFDEDEPSIKVTPVERPYINGISFIEPDEWGADDTYDTVFLEMTSDNVIIDEMGRSYTPMEELSLLYNEMAVESAKRQCRDDDIIQWEDPDRRQYVELAYTDQTYGDYLEEHPYIGTRQLDIDD